MSGACYDLEYDNQALKEMATVQQFSSVADKIDRAIHLKRQLDEEERKRKLKASASSAGQKMDYGSTIVREPLGQNTAGINDPNTVTRDHSTDLKPKSFD